MKILKKISYIVAITIITTVMSISISKGKTVEITTETLNLRKEPSTEADIVAQISIGDECELLGEDGDWYQVQYGEYTGYISKEYAEVVGEEDNTVTGNNGSDNNETTGNKNNTTEVDTSNNETAASEAGPQNGQTTAAGAEPPNDRTTASETEEES